MRGGGTFCPQKKIGVPPLAILFSPLKNYLCNFLKWTHQTLPLNRGVSFNGVFNSSNLIIEIWRLFSDLVTLKLTMFMGDELHSWDDFTMKLKI